MLKTDTIWRCKTLLWENICRGFLFPKLFIIKITNMKKILFTLVTLFTIVVLISCKNEKVKPIDKEKVLKLYYGKFAFCGASPATPTGNEIVVEGKTFKEGCAICPVMEGPAVANVLLVGDPFITPDSTDKTVWSYFWYYDSVPQAPTWQTLPTVNRTFVITDEPGGGMSNMWCMPCQILPEKVNGVTLAKCLGPINELAFPTRRAVEAVPGETSVTQAPIGATYPVGTIIPVFDTTKTK
jgi:hypothetical protein